MREKEGEKEQEENSEIPLMSFGCLSRMEESSLFLIVHLPTLYDDDVE